MYWLLALSRNMQIGVAWTRRGGVSTISSHCLTDTIDIILYIIVTVSDYYRPKVCAVTFSLLVALCLIFSSILLFSFISVVALIPILHHTSSQNNRRLQ
jgi:hypothetical protein